MITFCVVAASLPDFQSLSQILPSCFSSHAKAVHANKHHRVHRVYDTAAL